AACSRSSAGESSRGSGSCIDTSCLGSPTAASNSATTSGSDRASRHSAAERACWCRNALASSASGGPRRTPQQCLTLRPLPHGQRAPAARSVLDLLEAQERLPQQPVGPPQVSRRRCDQALVDHGEADPAPVAQAAADLQAPAEQLTGLCELAGLAVQVCQVAQG